MKKTSNCNIRRNKKLLVSDIIKYYETRGYTLTDANAHGLTLEKGSRRETLTSLNPLKWRTIVKLDVGKIERMHYNLNANYAFSSWGPFNSKKTKRYFAEETEAFNEAMVKFKVDIDKIEELGKEACEENKKNLYTSLYMGFIIAILLIFALNIYLPFNIPSYINSGITLLCFALCNYLIVRTK